MLSTFYSRQLIFRAALMVGLMDGRGGGGGGYQQDQPDRQLVVFSKTFQNPKTRTLCMLWDACYCAQPLADLERCIRVDRTGAPGECIVEAEVQVQTAFECTVEYRVHRYRLGYMRIPVRGV